VRAEQSRGEQRREKESRGEKRRAEGRMRAEGRHLTRADFADGLVLLLVFVVRREQVAAIHPRALTLAFEGADRDQVKRI
jgi:hypothetical protein